MGCAAHPGSPLQGTCMPSRAHAHHAFTSRPCCWLDRSSLSRLRKAGATRCLSVSTTCAFPEHTSRISPSPSLLPSAMGCPTIELGKKSMRAVSSREREYRSSFHSLGDSRLRSPRYHHLDDRSPLVALPQPVSLEHPLSPAEPQRELDLLFRRPGGLRLLSSGSRLQCSRIVVLRAA